MTDAQVVDRVRDLVWTVNHRGERVMEIASTIASLDDRKRELQKALAQRMWDTQMRETLCDLEMAIGLLTQGHDSA